jgi:hypothetical protein
LRGVETPNSLTIPSQIILGMAEYAKRLLNQRSEYLGEFGKFGGSCSLAEKTKDFGRRVRAVPEAVLFLN